MLRWGILGPLSYLIPPLRRFVVHYLSTLVINPTYQRRMPEGRMARRWMIEEAGDRAGVLVGGAGDRGPA